MMRSRALSSGALVIVALVVGIAGTALWMRGHSITPEVSTAPAASGAAESPRLASTARTIPPVSTGKSPLPEHPSQVAAPTLQAMEARFQEQPRDAQAMVVEDRLLQALVDKQLATSGIIAADPDVSCRQSACRVVATFRSESDAAAWGVLYMTVAGSLVNRAQPLFVRQPDGSVQMRLFASRMN